MARIDGDELGERQLARETVTEDAAGEDVIDIYGAIKSGWQLHEVTR
jgi:hypothetical protein